MTPDNNNYNLDGNSVEEREGTGDQRNYGTRKYYDGQKKIGAIVDKITSGEVDGVEQILRNRRICEKLC